MPEQNIYNEHALATARREAIRQAGINRTTKTTEEMDNRPAAGLPLSGSRVEPGKTYGGPGNDRLPSR